MELKLISNKDAENKRVLEQINSYVKYFSENIGSIVESYKKNYEQKKALGLFALEFPESIEIQSSIEKVIIIADGHQKAVMLKDNLKNDFDGKIITLQFDLAKEFE